MHEIQLKGLDGGNLLGYLAALGTLRVLTLAEPDAQVRMSWREMAWWTPVIHNAQIATDEQVVETLAMKICPPMDANAAFQQDHLDEPLLGFRENLRAAALAGREEADFYAAIGSDAFSESDKEPKPATTALRAIGAGNNDGFLGLMRTIHQDTRIEHLFKALFNSWDYSDPPPFMRWDPNEYRPHALRADDPAKDRKRNNVRGANRLAIEALPLFPMVPERRQARTVAFTKQNGEVIVTWPIWSEPLSLDAVRSLLVLDEVQSADPSVMARRGIAQVFRAQRFTDGKYRNFSLARALL
jgi:hypothetical protein